MSDTPRTITIRVALVPFPGNTFRAATIIGGQTFYGEKLNSESAALANLFAQLGQTGPFASAVSLALDLEVMGDGELKRLLESGEQ